LIFFKKKNTLMRHGAQFLNFAAPLLLQWQERKIHPLNSKSVHDTAAVLT